MNQFIAFIPARIASTRFPGKPLVDMFGKPMIQRVYERVHSVIEEVYVATDDQRIYDTVLAFGGKAVMTSDQHKSGTDRCYEAFCKVDRNQDVILNIQGDEPFVSTHQITTLMECFERETTQIATLVKPFSHNDSWESLSNPNSPKVVINSLNEALYFSRSVIPYLRGVQSAEWCKHHTYYKHIGMYGYRAEVLKEITALPQTALEIAESLEQLRWLESGYTIGIGNTLEETIGIDTPEDMERALLFMQQNNLL